MGSGLRHGLRSQGYRTYGHATPTPSKCQSRRSTPIKLGFFLDLLRERRMFDSTESDLARPLRYSTNAPPHSRSHPSSSPCPEPFPTGPPEVSLTRKEPPVMRNPNAARLTAGGHLTSCTPPTTVAPRFAPERCAAPTVIEHERCRRIPLSHFIPETQTPPTGRTGFRKP